MTIQDAKTYARDPMTKRLQRRVSIARAELDKTRKHVNSYRLDGPHLPSQPQLLTS